MAVPSWLSALEVNCQSWRPGMLSGHQRGPRPELSLTGKSHTTASCLHWLFIYDSKCLRNRIAINEVHFCAGEGCCPRDPPSISTVNSTLRIVPLVFQPVGLGPAKAVLGATFPGSQPAAWNKPGSHLTQTGHLNPQLSSPLPPSCGPPSATSTYQASGSS